LDRAFESEGVLTSEPVQRRTRVGYSDARQTAEAPEPADDLEPNIWRRLLPPEAPLYLGIDGSTVLVQK
jgi:hypothetical protein